MKKDKTQEKLQRYLATNSSSYTLLGNCEENEVIDLYNLIRSKYRDSFLLESLSESDSNSRYSYIGFCPIAELSCFEKGEVVAKKNPERSNTVIEDFQNTYTTQNGEEFSIIKGFTTEETNIDATGGLFGYSTFESFGLSEQSTKLKPDEHFGYFYFGLFDHIVIYDKVTGVLSYRYRDNELLENIRSLVAELQKAKTKYPVQELKVKHIERELSKERYLENVKHIKDKIEEGFVYQCVYSIKDEYEIQEDDFEIYKRLREVNPSPHMYYLSFGEKRLIGASPELLIRVKDRLVETYPLAGTIHRGENESQDQKLARELVNDKKEIAEHNMLVDLHRNDLNKVCRPGSVTINRLYDIKRFSHVQHISSEIVGFLDQGQNIVDALVATLPAGTLIGAPKVEASKILGELEDKPRGPYGGAVGFISPNGDGEFAIPIRSIFIYKKRAFTQTGCGIVFDSIPEKEYKELEAKLAAMNKVLRYFQDD